MRTILGAVLAAILVPAAAQTPAPAPAPAAAAPATEAPKPRPPLKLQLDETDMRSLMTLTPREAEKKEDDGLPALGGNASPNLERKAADVVPKDLTPGR